MARFVVLRHDCPDGSWHLDWMIQRTDPAADPARPLLSFRVGFSPLEADEFDAQRIADHRAVYLDYDGEISGGRGSVTRLTSGSASIAVFDARRIEVVLDGSRRLVGRSDDGAAWRFELAAG